MIGTARDMADEQTVPFEFFGGKPHSFQVQHTGNFLCAAGSAQWNLLAGVAGYCDGAAMRRTAERCAAADPRVCGGGMMGMRGSVRPSNDPRRWADGLRQGVVNCLF